MIKETIDSLEIIHFDGLSLDQISDRLIAWAAKYNKYKRLELREVELSSDYHNDGLIYYRYQLVGIRDKTEKELLKEKKEEEIREKKEKEYDLNKLRYLLEKYGNPDKKTS